MIELFDTAVPVAVFVGTRYTSNEMPWASGRSFDQLIVFVWRRM